MSDGWFRGPQWASPAAQAEWEDRLAAAAKAWEELEVLSIAPGVRDSALVYLQPDELVRATADGARMGLQVVPVSWDGASVRTAICRPELMPDWLNAWAAGDDVRIGQLLGFPACCVEFFKRTWGPHRDTTWAMVADGASADGPPAANILLRRLGVRLVPHLPCSFGCEASAQLGARIAAAGRAAGLEDVDEIERLLSLPMSWSACNGAAMVNVGGILRFIYETDPSPHVGFKRDGLWVDLLDPIPPAWRDNGFSSRQAMDIAHGAVAAIVGAAESAIDLGAGDGALLARIAGGREGGWLAVEADPGRVERGRRRRPNLDFFAGRIEALPFEELLPADVVLLMPGRLLEMSADDAQCVRSNLRRIARRLVVYAYGDCLKDGGLARLFLEAGLEGHLPLISAGPGVHAAEVIW